MRKGNKRTDKAKEPGKTNPFKNPQRSYHKGPIVLMCLDTRFHFTGSIVFKKANIPPVF